MMKTVSLIAAGLMCAGLTAPAISGDAAAGAKTAQSCIMCHGENGLQLRQFRDGKRHNEVMNVIAKPLSDADIDNVAAYFAQFEVELKKR